jgi:TetR/AcrR family transcriptional regulator, cholesterol catabolism regulator
MDGSAPIRIQEEIAALKRERIVGAAVNLFYERGYDNTTLEAVAENLGVTKPFIYSHFGSKAELLADICSRGISASLRALESVEADKLGPTRSVAAFGERFVTAVLENQKYIAIFTREEKALTEEALTLINQMRRTFDRKLTDLIREGVEKKEFHVSDPHVAALSIGGMVSWAYVWYRPGGRLTVAQTATEMTYLMLSMLTAKNSRL